MTVSCGRTGYVYQEGVKLDRRVMLRLWHTFMNLSYSSTGKEGGKTFWRHEHPALPFVLERFFEKENPGSWSTGARFVGEGWHITFVHRRYRGKIQDVIDFNTSLALGSENDFDHDWTLATLAA